MPRAADRPGTRLLDELAANATAGGTVHQLDGWLLRTAPDLPFRRANSVLVAGAPRVTGARLDERLAAVGDFYLRRGRTPYLQITPPVACAALDRELAARGWVVEAPVEVCVGRLAVVARRAARPAAGVTVRATSGLHARDRRRHEPHATAGTPSRLAGYQRLLARIGTPAFTAWADLDGEPAGVGIGVVERGWLGVFGMHTADSARRRGVARSVLDALVTAGVATGARSAYLQVELDNEPARRLYTSLGFTPHHAYHYRRPSPR